MYKMYVNVLDKHRNLKEKVYHRINTFFFINGRLNFALIEVNDNPSIVVV